ncbi:MAG: porin [Betaproteobacteria bacterium]|nr:porin [Betaproteobacteria bacterium]
MKLKLIALAVAGATMAPMAMAQTANPVTLYGTLNIDFDSTKASNASTGANVGARNRVTSNSANFGIRGTEDLGGGMKAFFQVEMGTVALDTGGGNLAGRNSAVGLQGGAGSILLGNWDTPYKSASGPVDAFYGTGVANYVNVISGNSTPTAASGATRNGFDRRANNVVQWWSPNWNGLSLRAGYGANEGRTNSTTTPSQNPSLTSFSAVYAKGPFMVSGAYEKHDQFANSATQSSKDTGMKFAATAVVGTTTFGVVTERLKFQGNIGATGLSKVFTAGTGTEAKVNSYYASVVHRMGPWAFRAGIGADRGVRVNTVAGAPDTRARMLAVGGSYSFSKRTDAYVLFSQIKNDNNSRNDFAIGAVGGVSQGADPRALGFGLRHTF